MSERYSRLFSLPENLYSEGSPIVISAGALLKDNQTGEVIAQLKIKNISDKNIKAAKVLITAFDTVGNKFDEKVSFEFLDLNIGRDEEFGQKTPIVLSNDKTRQFSVCVESIVFFDNSIWNYDVKEQKPLTVQKTLNEVFDDAELIKQYQIKFKSTCKYLPEQDRDLWLCSCGKINHSEEESCHNCKCFNRELFSLDLEKLKEEKEERLLNEEKKRQEERLAKKKAKKKTLVALLVFAVLIAATTVFYTSGLADELRYKSAINLIDNEKYEKALSEFEALETNQHFDDEKIRDCTYYKAVAMLKVQKFDDAIEIFESLDGYKDSNELLLSAKIAAIKNASVGDNVSFGKYFKGLSYNHLDKYFDMQEVKWIVLDKTENSVLLLSEYAIDWKKYKDDDQTCWKDSFIREWLNETLIDDLFDKEEQKYISVTNVEYTKSQESKKYAVTKDRLFLLSESEVEKYLSDEQRKCQITPYGTKIASKGEYNWYSKTTWWLRTPGFIKRCASGVDADGSYVDSFLANDGGGVRPAIWVNLAS